MIVGSPRQALAYLFAAQQGPGMARPKHHDAPTRDTGRSHWDHVMVGAMLYGRRILGNCGVVQGSHLDAKLRLWATQRGAIERDDQILAIERRMRALLRAHGMMATQRRFRARRELDTGDGTPTLRAIGFDAGESACATVQNVLRLP